MYVLGAVVGRREWLEGFGLRQQTVATKKSERAQVLSKSLCRRAGSQGPLSALHIGVRAATVLLLNSSQGCLHLGLFPPFWSCGQDGRMDSHPLSFPGLAFLVGSQGQGVQE